MMTGQNRGQTRGQARGTAAVARHRLLGDKAVRPLAERRAELEVLGGRLERAIRRAMTDHLAGRVRGNREFAPVLGRLMRMALDA